MSCPPILWQDFVEAIEALPEFDKPSYFGLPENIERSSQRIVSGNVISQLKILKRADVKASKFDKDVWATELGPILNVWKKLNQVRGVYISYLIATTITGYQVMCGSQVCVVNVDISHLIITTTVISHLKAMVIRKLNFLP